jgi:hypothetical protein
MTNTTELRHEAWLQERITDDSSVNVVEAVPFSEALRGAPDFSLNGSGLTRPTEEPGFMEKVSRLRNARIEQHAAVRAARKGEGAMAWADIALEMGLTSHDGRQVKKFHDSEPPGPMPV